MVNVEKASTVAMEIITYAGLAKSNYIEALRLYRDGNNNYEQKIEEGNKSFTMAHSSHMAFLSREMETNESQITMLLAHAEDQLMSAETIRILVEELIATIAILK